jgi:hypothetical protein
MGGMKLCACGRKLWGLGSRCPVCQAQHRVFKAATRLAKGYYAYRERAASPRDNPEHLAFIRGLPCCVAGCRNQSIKPSPKWCVPMCNDHHREQHSIGEESFEKKYHLSLKAIASNCAALSPWL